MATEDKSDKSLVERAFPDPRDVLGLMVSFQRLSQQLVWQMGEAMTDMMEIPMGRDRNESKKPNPVARAVADLTDAVDSATQTLQQGGKPR
jgi:hypothetical protein